MYRALTARDLAAKLLDALHHHGRELGRVRAFVHPSDTGLLEPEDLHATLEASLDHPFDDLVHGGVARLTMLVTTVPAQFRLGSRLPRGGPRCIRQAEVARLGTGRAIGGYVAQGLFAGCGFGLLTLIAGFEETSGRCQPPSFDPEAPHTLGRLRALVR